MRSGYSKLFQTFLVLWLVFIHSAPASAAPFSEIVRDLIDPISGLVIDFTRDLERIVRSFHAEPDNLEHAGKPDVLPNEKFQSKIALSPLQSGDVADKGILKLPEPKRRKLAQHLKEYLKGEGEDLGGWNICRVLADRENIKKDIMRFEVSDIKIKPSRKYNVQSLANVILTRFINSLQEYGKVSPDDCKRSEDFVPVAAKISAAEIGNALNKTFDISANHP